jgi:phage shock protein E
VRTRHLVATLALSVAVAGCAATDAASPAAQPTASEAAVSSADGTADVAAQADGRVLLDVRTPEEVAQGHLEGAVLIDLQGPDFRAAVSELPRDEAYFVYCRSGNRSGQAIEIMRDLGFTDLVNGGGYEDLVDAGLPATS